MLDKHYCCFTALPTVLNLILKFSCINCIQCTISSDNQQNSFRIIVCNGYTHTIDTVNVRLK